MLSKKREEVTYIQEKIADIPDMMNIVWIIYLIE